MPRYTSSDPVLSGVPLGGIGGGKVEILPNGLLDNITFLNNWERPLSHPGNAAAGHSRGLPGFHFGLWVEGHGAWLLQTQPVGAIPIVQRIRYEGLYPVARLGYEKTGPLQVHLDAWNPVIPRNTQASGWPVAIFSFRIKNTGTKSLQISLLGILRNIAGDCPIGRLNRLETQGKLVSLVASQKKPKPGDPSSGELSLSIPKSAGSVSALASWNLQKVDFQFDFDSLNLEPAWTLFSTKGCLGSCVMSREPRTHDTRHTTHDIVQGGGVELGGALAVKRQISPGKEVPIPFYLSWHFPNHLIGHQYAKKFRNSVAVSLAVDQQRAALWTGLSRWHQKIARWGCPDWLKDAVLNNLYVLTSGSWWGKRGEFSLYEAPVICPLMSTLDVRFWGSLPIALFFPELEKRELLAFAKAQRPDGYIPHDLGRSRLDAPSDGTTRYRWKDLAPQFILQAYRDFLWTKDDPFLKAIYPACRKAMAWEWTTDHNGDGLPDHEGADQTFDVWPMYGASAYMGSLYLASLKALEKMAALQKDWATARTCEKRFLPAQKSFETQLWNGRYFIGWRDRDRSSEACTVAQLTGSWMARLLDLGPILDPPKLRVAIQSVLDLNGGDSPFGATNAVFPDRRRDSANLHSRAIWPGLNYMLAALAIYEGKQEEGLGVAERVWRAMTETVKNPWNQPDILDPDTAAYGFGDSYMRNMSIWAIPLALGLV